MWKPDPGEKESDMKLWLLEPIDPHSGVWVPWYDKAFAFVVRAETARDARVWADENSGDESKRHGAVWLNPELTRCRRLTEKGKAGVVVRDFAAA